MKKSRTRKPRGVTKRELGKFVRQGKTTKSIARYYRVSESTIKRKIRKYGLSRLRKRGRKPLVERPKLPKLKAEWVSLKRYIGELDKRYHFINIKYPAFKFINPATLVCSNERRDPRGEFTTASIYYIILQSDVYFVYLTRIRYSKEPVDFEEIYSWVKENAYDILATRWLRTPVTVIEPIAFTFLNLRKKPREVFI